MAGHSSLLMIAIGSLVSVGVTYITRRRMEARRRAADPLPENTGDANVPPSLDTPLSKIKGGSIGLTIHQARRALHKRASKRRLRAEVRAAPTLTPTTADAARVQITGVIELLDDPLIAPLSARPCVACHARLYARGNHFPSIQHETIQSCRFVVDGIVIDSQHLRLDFAALKLPPSVEQSARYDAFARTFGLARRDARFEAPESYTEIIVAVGQRVTVVGTVVRDPVAPTTEELGFREQPPARVRLVGNAEHPVLLGPARKAAKA